MAMLNSIKKIPIKGDVVKSVIHNEEHNLSTVVMESGKEFIIHTFLENEVYQEPRTAHQSHIKALNRLNNWISCRRDQSSFVDNLDSLEDWSNKLNSSKPMFVISDTDSAANCLCLATHHETAEWIAERLNLAAEYENTVRSNIGVCDIKDTKNIFRRFVEKVTDKVCGSGGLKNGKDVIDTIRDEFPNLYCKLDSKKEGKNK